jgi:arylsulfatase A-like enzyme
MYYAVISDMDHQIGRILKALDDTGERENTIVIFASDHGMGVGSHGLRGKQSMYEHTINVPLIVAGPGVKGGGRRTAAQVYLRDLFPTTCELAGVGLPAGQALDGLSFAPVLRGEVERFHPEVFCYFRDVQRMVRDDRSKLIYYPDLKKYELFDLVTDPYETVDLSGGAAHRETFLRLKAGLERWQAGVDDPIRTIDD